MAYSCKQMPLYNFIILRKKETPAQMFSCGICQTLKNSGGCFFTLKKLRKA